MGGGSKLNALDYPWTMGRAFGTGRDGYFRMNGCKIKSPDWRLGLGAACQRDRRTASAGRSGAALPSSKRAWDSPGAVPNSCVQRKAATPRLQQGDSHLRQIVVPD
jgi:hypothetical protein